MLARRSLGTRLVSPMPMSPLPRLLQDDFAAYEDSLKRICAMKRDYPQIEVCFTHQTGV